MPPVERVSAPPLTGEEKDTQRNAVIFAQGSAAFPIPLQDATTYTPIAELMITGQMRFQTLEPCFEGTVMRGMRPQGNVKVLWYWG